MLVYIDISEFIKSRALTGIQRVQKEYIQKAILNAEPLRILNFNPAINSFELIPNDEVLEFFKDIKNYQLKQYEPLDIFAQHQEDKIFFDMDSVWNATPKRRILYPKLKESDFQIFNFIYDFIPFLFPEYSHAKSARNFPSFLSAVYECSDLVFFDSHSARKDFFTLKNELKIDKVYPTEVIPLGSDFTKVNTPKPQEFEALLNSKYILFVGTLEPRKNQQKVLEAFELLVQKYEDLNLVLIGKQGWKVDDFAQILAAHPLKNKKLFWLQTIDDNTLNHFYENAFIVTYLSQYEGYGLPIAESLNFGNITIASKNSSMYEVGQDYADYIVHNSVAEIVDIISLYYENQELYNEKKEFIKKEYKSLSWNDMYNSLKVVFDKYQNS
ncbi:MAG: glycosyltransferase family 1 protein [Campylobacterales bacterium]|nr:glycosyltransferase family 1 protein [Campylobacterales bacterium]